MHKSKNKSSENYPGMRIFKSLDKMFLQHATEKEFFAYCWD